MATHEHWAAAVLYNGLARCEEAASAARHATSGTFEPWFSTWALPELVEAAARTRSTGVATGALERLAEATRPGGTDWALGIEARCRALLTSGDSADLLYREAIDRLGRAWLRPGAGPRVPAVRGVAAPRGPAPRRARSAAHRPRHARRDRDGGVRRARAGN